MNLYRYEPRADIAKCPGQNCPEKTTCLRFLRADAEQQTYCDFNLHLNISLSCEHRIPDLTPSTYAIG